MKKIDMLIKKPIGVFVKGGKLFNEQPTEEMVEVFNLSREDGFEYCAGKVSGDVIDSPYKYFFFILPSSGAIRSLLGEGDDYKRSMLAVNLMYNVWEYIDMGGTDFQDLVFKSRLIKRVAIMADTLNTKFDTRMSEELCSNIVDVAVEMYEAVQFEGDEEISLGEFFDAIVDAGWSFNAQTSPYDDRKSGQRVAVAPHFDRGDCDFKLKISKRGLITLEKWSGGFLSYLDTMIKSKKPTRRMMEYLSDFENNYFRRYR